MCATVGPGGGSGGGGGGSGGGSTLLCGCPNGYEPASSVMIHLEDLNPDPNKPNISGNYILTLVEAFPGSSCSWSGTFGNSNFYYTITLVWWPEPGPNGVYYLHLNLDSLNEGYICPIGFGNTAPENRCVVIFITQPCAQQN
jgi:hypothetical protein